MPWYDPYLLFWHLAFRPPPSFPIPGFDVITTIAPSLILGPQRSFGKSGSVSAADFVHGIALLMMMSIGYCCKGQLSVVLIRGQPTPCWHINVAWLPRITASVHVACLGKRVSLPSQLKFKIELLSLMRECVVCGLLTVPPGGRFCKLTRYLLGRGTSTPHPHALRVMGPHTLRSTNHEESNSTRHPFPSPS